MSTVQNKIKNLHELGAADVGIATDVEANATMHNRAPMVVNTPTTLNNMDLASIQATGSTEFLYTGLTGGQTVATTGVQLANDNGDGVTLALDWAYVGAGDYAIDFIVLDNSATGDNLAYVNITGVNTATSPRLDTTNWKLTDNQYGYKLIFKSRSLATNHVEFNSITREGKYLSSNTTAILTTDATTLLAVNPFSVDIGTSTLINTDLATYVLTAEQTIRRTPGYRTDAGVIQNSKNNTGTDLLEKDNAGVGQIRHFNPVQGNEIVLDTGNGVAGRSITTGGKYGLFHRHGLSGTAYDWRSYNSFDGANRYFVRNTTLASTVDLTYWNNTEPTQNTMTVGSPVSVNASGIQYITYGYYSTANTKITVYQGTQASNFIELGLKMTINGSRVMAKRTDVASEWVIVDNVRGVGVRLYADKANVEEPITVGWEFTETGIIINETSTASAGVNVSGGSYIIIATTPYYAKPLDGNKIGFNSEVKVVFADGKSASNALVTKEKTFTTLVESAVPHSYAGRKAYTRISDLGIVTYSERAMNSGKSRKDADKWGEWSDSRELTKTTARHGTYTSETGTVSASSVYDADRQPFKAFNKEDDVNGWMSANGSFVASIGDESLIIDLTENRLPVSMRYKTRNEPTTFLTIQPVDFTIEHTLDEVIWTPILTVVGTTLITTQNGVSELFDLSALAVTTGKLRFRTTKTNGGAYVGIGEWLIDFAISDEPYLNTEDNVVYDSTDTKTYLCELGNTNVDSQGNTYDLVNYEPNKVHLNELQVHGIADLSGNTVLLTNKNSILPDLVTIDKRYILDNPFGNDVPCHVTAEIFMNGVWSETGFGDSATLSTGYGTAAFYNESEGIIVQAGKTAVAYLLSSTSGGGHGSNGGGSLLSAPCRVRVTRIGGK